MDFPLNASVDSRAAFTRFVETLRDDLEKNPSHWENKTLPEFLEAMARYAEDIQDFYNNTAQNGQPPLDADVATWERFADILSGARVYE